MLTTQSIKDLHQLIQEALVKDDTNGPGPKPYGVREHPDWRKQTDAYEAELRKRQVVFSLIDWEVTDKP